ncbi:NifB/NifX family molybdenum-iron cluster-binding protein [Acidobacteriota bacterium]
MKIAVSASGPELSGPVDPRFGRCSHFLFVDSETMQSEAIENPNVAFSSGAGIQSAQIIAKKGATVLLTGSCGPNAFQTLQTAGVKVVVGVTGTIQAAIQQFKAGQLQSTTQPNVSAHSGMQAGGGVPMGPGLGMGRGMGRGMGGGMGRVMGYRPSFQVPGMPSPTPNIPLSSPGEELQHLKQQAESLRQQMENITKKIEDIEKKATDIGTK